MLAVLVQIVFPQSAAAATCQPDITVTPASIDFGEVTVGTYSAPVTVTVRNDGDTDLVIYSVDIAGTDAFQFYISSIQATSQVIPPGGSASGTIVFNPTSAGDKSARLRICSNDPHDPWAYVYLYGTGVYEPSLQPDIAVQPPALDFGPVQVSTSSPPRTVTVTNEGTANLVLYSASIGGTDASQFSIGTIDATSHVLVPGESTSGTILFSPTSAGDKSAYLRIYSSDPDECWVYVDLTGEGVTESVAPDITVSPLSVDFGSIPVGSSSPAENVTVTNDGTAYLDIGNLTIDNGLFSISSGNISGQTFAPGDSANISLIFSPVAAGAQSAELSIPSNDPDEDPVVVALTGSGQESTTEPDISVTPDFIDFGSIPAGTSSAAENITVTNEGDADLVIGNLTLDNIYFAISSGNISGQTLGPGDSANISLVFSPAITGAQIAQLTIPSNDPDEDPLPVFLYGTGTAPLYPNITVYPLSIDFGPIESGNTSPPQTVTITSDGTADLILGTISIGGPDFTEFDIVSDNASGQTLPPGTSANVSVSFSPVSPGDKLAHLVILSNDPDINPVPVELKGSGTEAAAPDISISPLFIDFGFVETGTTSAAENITVTNEGSADLVIGNLTLDNTYFAISSGNISGQTLGPGDSANISLIFSPAVTGTQIAQLTIPSNDPDEDPLVAPLYGTGTAPLYPNIAVSPATLDFGQIVTGETSLPQTVTVTSDGTADLVLGTVSIGGPDAMNFSILSDNVSGQTLPPGTSANISVVFSPASAGFKGAPLVIFCNDPDNLSPVVHLYGTGIEPDIDVSPVSIDYGDLPVGATSAPVPVTIANIGTYDLIIGSITIVGTDPLDFIIASDNASGHTLGPGESANISVRFSPQDVGARVAGVQIPSSDPDESAVFVLLNGTGTTPPEPDIDVVPMSLDFGSTIPVGQTGAQRLVTISNIGTADLFIGALVIVGSNPDDFVIFIDEASGATLPPGSSVHVYLRFSPTAIGLREGGLQIPSNDPDESQVVVALAGTGAGTPDILVDPLYIDFGYVQVGDSSADRVVTITNVGTADLLIDLAALSGYDSPHFTITDDSASGNTLIPGASTTVSLRFTPSDAGFKSAELVIASYDPDESYSYVYLFGTATEAPQPRIQVEPDYIDFGTVTAGSSSALSTVTITNAGGADLIVYALFLSGVDQTEFSIPYDYASGQTLAPGATANFPVQFNPVTAGPKSGVIEIYSNDPSYTYFPFYVYLAGNAGTVPVPDITVEPPDINFGNILVGADSPDEMVTITNDGDADLFIGDIDIVGMDPGDFAIVGDGASGGTLAPGAFAVVSVRFSPLSPGLKSAAVQVPSSDPDEPAVYVPLYGNGTAPDIAVDPPAVNFSYVQVSTTSPPRNVTVTNEGTADLNIGTVMLTGGDVSEFSIASDNASLKTLPPGSSVGITVTFTPSSAGTKSTYLIIPSDDPDENPVSVTLSGTGTTEPLTPDITVSPLSLDFGDVLAGTDSATQNVTISNDGTADLLIGNLTIDSGLFSIVSGNISGQTLGPDASANVTLVFSPVSEGAQSANLTIPSDDPDEGEIKVELSGNGFVPYADLSIAKYDSPDPVAAGADLTYTLIVTNNGPSDASGVSVIDNLPAGTVFQSATTLTGSASHTSGNVTWDIGSLGIGASANLTIIVTAPTIAGTYTNNASVTGVEADPLASNNNASVITTVLAGSYPDITVSPALIDFGTVLVNTSSAGENVTVTNDGTADLVIGAVTVNDAQFVISSADIPGNTLVPGASANITIVFTPTATGLQSADLTIPSNDPDENLVTVALRGTGIEPDINVTPLYIFLGRVEKGMSSSTKKVTVTNEGTAPLSIGNLTINNARFIISSGNISGQILLPDASADIMLVFRPVAAGAQSATLTIPSDDPDENPVIVFLSGLGTSPGPGPGPNPPEPTPTPTSTPQAGPLEYFTVDFLSEITREIAENGRPIKDMKAPSPDGIQLLEIEAWTAASDNAGLMVTLLEIREAPVPDLPENTVLVGKAYEFKPTGTVFDRPIRLTLGYDVNELPDGVISVGAAYYTSDGWVYLETEPSNVAELGRLTAPVNHFTVFAVLAKVTPQTGPPPEPEPEPVPEPGPEPGPEITPASFVLSHLSITASETRYFEHWTYVVNTGEEAVITVDVTNDGGETGVYTVTLLINTVPREQKEITLGPGQTETVSFTVTSDETGRYDVAIGEMTGSFFHEIWVNWWLIAGTTGALILLAWLVWYIINRRRKAKTQA